MEAQISSSVGSLTILIASFGRPQVLAQGLEKISSNLPTFKFEIRLMLQRGEEGYSEVLESFSSLPINILEVKHKPGPGASRNLLIEGVESEWLCFLDDDVQISKEYFNVASEIIKQEGLDVFGGPDQALPGLEQKLIGKVLSQKFVMGPTFARHSRNAPETKSATELELTLCNLWIKSEIFKKYDIKFDSKLLRCEENLLIDQVIKAGVQLGYFPKLFVYHLRRVKIFEILPLQLKSGFYRGIEITDKDSIFKPAFLIPFGAGLGLIFLPFLFPQLFLGFVILHAFFNLLTSIKISLELKSVGAIWKAILIITLIHFGFSLGLVLGWFKGQVNEK